MYCKHCGTKIDNDSLYCAYCQVYTGQQPYTQGVNPQDTSAQDTCAQEPNPQGASAQEQNPEDPYNQQAYNQGPNPQDTYNQQSYNQGPNPQDPYNQQQYYQQQYGQQQYNQQHQTSKKTDSSSVGFGFLGFFVPLAGLILYFIWRDEKPLTAKSCITGTIISFILGAVSFAICFITIMIMIFSTSVLYY